MRWRSWVVGCWVVAACAPVYAQWVVKRVQDAMTGAEGDAACIRSANAVAGTAARLCVQFLSDGEGLTVVMHDGRGVFCAVPCQARVRLDNEPPERFDAETVAGGEKAGLMLFGSDRLVERIAAARLVRVEVGIGGAGLQVLEFRSAGLKLAKPQ